MRRVSCGIQQKLQLCEIVANLLFVIVGMNPLTCGSLPRMATLLKKLLSGKEYFLCDFKGHCVVVFNEAGQFLRRIGCESITNFPNGIDISDAGDVLVVDSHENRFHVAVFSRDGSLLSEFECPCVKVSQCCGLKITSENYVVSLAKNNHHVLVLSTLLDHVSKVSRGYAASSKLKSGGCTQIRIEEYKKARQKRE